MSITEALGADPLAFLILADLPMRLRRAESRTRTGHAAARSVDLRRMEGKTFPLPRRGYFAHRRWLPFAPVMPNDHP
jgi:hypothetical protein